MKDAVPHRKEQEHGIIARLSDLFAEIDIDGDKEMTWEVTASARQALTHTRNSLHSLLNQVWNLLTLSNR